VSLENNELIFKLSFVNSNKFVSFVARLSHVSVSILQNPEPEVDFDTVANEMKQHEVNVGKLQHHHHPRTRC
jgi:hypothetical protein